MTLGFGLLGALTFLAAALLLPLRLCVRMTYPDPSEAEVRLLWWTVSRWRAAPHPASPATRNQGKEHGGAPSPLTSLETFEAFLGPLQSTPVGNLRIAARAGAGDPAVTAVLYGAAWSVLSTLLSIRGIQPAALRLDPVMEGTAQLRARGEAEVRVTLLLLLQAAARALRTLRAGSAG